MKKTILPVVLVLILLICVLTGCSGYKWKTFDEYSAMLAESNTFNTVDNDPKYSDTDYNFEDPVLAQIKATYGIEAIAGAGDELSKTINLLAWVSKNVTHDGSKNVNVAVENGYTLLQHSFGKKDNGINCRQKAVILNDCLHAVGIKSKMCFLMPKDGNTGDNHVGNIVYITVLNKWILVDSSWNAYFQDGEGNYLDPFELRTAFAEKTVVKINPNAQWNDVVFDEEQDFYYRKYMAKNLYWFQTKPTKTSSILCAPEGFDLNKWHVDNLKSSKNNYSKSVYKQNMDFFKNGKFTNYTKAELLKV